ncbi:hypothetical protein DL764_008948 [Monosporascus ibericus]|uniref:Uncharacterized protein n=1 Tax=Monosporascus ibericus TaxID=155417 RepID=A0A4Q4SZC4_9PEZI|nr:hypothetical protein DL764_008948 [Monosporascus ibericus]
MTDYGIGDQDENVDRKAQETVHAAADAVLDRLAFQVRHAGEIGAHAHLEQAENPEQQALGLQHSPRDRQQLATTITAMTTFNAPCGVWAAVRSVYMMDPAIVAHMKL